MEHTYLERMEQKFLFINIITHTDRHPQQGKRGSHTMQQE